jgi:hypothetical protein
MLDKVDLLINILLDDTAREDEKDDAAMDLGKYDDDRALVALSQVGSNPNEDAMVQDSCGESIAEILVTRGRYNKDMIDKLTPVAKDAAYSYIKATKPEWLNML